MTQGATENCTTVEIQKYIYTCMENIMTESEKRLGIVRAIQKNKVHKFVKELIELERSNPDSYNNQWCKKLDDEICDWHKPITFNGFYVGYAQTNRRRAIMNNRMFFNNLKRRVNRYAKTLNLRRWIVIENKNGKLHSHMILETPRGIETSTFMKMCLLSWNQCKWSQEAFLKDTSLLVDWLRDDSNYTIHLGMFSRSFGGYTVKEHTRHTDNIDTTNCLLHLA